MKDQPAPISISGVRSLIPIENLAAITKDVTSRKSQAAPPQPFSFAKPVSV